MEMLSRYSVAYRTTSEITVMMVKSSILISKIEPQRYPAPKATVSLQMKVKAHTPMMPRQ